MIATHLSRVDCITFPDFCVYDICYRELIHHQTCLAQVGHVSVASANGSSLRDTAGIHCNIAMQMQLQSAFAYLQVAQTMMHACKLMLLIKPHQRHKTLFALHNQAPTEIKMQVSKVCPFRTV